MKWLRLLVALLVGCVGALLLFWLMQYLITPDARVDRKPVNYNMVDFVRVQRESSDIIHKKRLPPEPTPDPVPHTATSRLKLSAVEQPQMAVNAERPALGSRTFAGGPKLSLGDFQGDSELTPLVRIAPQYPPRARRLGIEGYVKARLAVDENGHVQSIEIFESEPSGEFDRTVRRTLKRWKFKPKVVNGKAIAYSGTVTLQFKIKK